jgi:hypothetical protein
MITDICVLKKESVCSMELVTMFYDALNQRVFFLTAAASRSKQQHCKEWLSYM